MTNILLTGRPGVGKTTLIQGILQSSRLKPGGFYTHELRKRNARVGFEIITLSGTRGILSHIDVKSPYRVGKYRVNLEDLDRVAVAEIWRALREEELVVIDEIGKMELYSEKFKEAMLAALDSEKPVLGTIMLGSTPFIDTIKRRPDVELIQVTEANRDSLEEEIVKRVESLKSQAEK